MPNTETFAASGAGIICIHNNGLYNAAKFGIAGLTRNAAMDYGTHSIRVSALAPESTMTLLMKNAFEQNFGHEFKESIIVGIRFANRLNRETREMQLAGCVRIRHE